MTKSLTEISNLKKTSFRIRLFTSIVAFLIGITFQPNLPPKMFIAYIGVLLFSCGLLYLNLFIVSQFLITNESINTKYVIDGSDKKYKIKIEDYSNKKIAVVISEHEKSVKSLGNRPFFYYDYLVIPKKHIFVSKDIKKYQITIPTETHTQKFSNIFSEQNFLGDISMEVSEKFAKKLQL